MTAQPAQARPKVFYGWWVVTALCAIMFLSAGPAFYAMGVFVVPFQDEFGWSRGQISIAISLGALISGLFGPVAGTLVGRVGARRLMGVGGVMMGISLGLLGLTQSLAYFYVMFMIMAAWRSSTMIVPVGAVVANWFDRRRGLALGLTTAGIGLGGLVMAPLAAVLIDAVGWQATFFIEGAMIVGVTIPLAAFVIRQHPSEMGLLPDGAEASVELHTAEDARPAGWSLGEALRTPVFYVVSAAFSLAFATLGAVLIHVVPFLEDQGFSRATAGLILGCVSGVGVLGKIGSGYLADRTSPRFVSAAVFVMQAVGLFVLLQGGGSVLGIVVFALVFGYSMGAVVALQPMMAVHCFGMASIATILGAMVAVTSAFNALGPITAGFVYDATGAYSIIFVAYIVIDCLAAGLIYFLGRQPSQAPAFDGALVEGSD
ncbi:MAG TPA: MFS transporter [Dehalococcoidia bacterium]|nr:MFS transporter [Dehalococcoidia bacterium]